MQAQFIVLARKSVRSRPPPERFSLLIRILDPALDLCAAQKNYRGIKHTKPLG